MYWSTYDTLVLLTGILTAVLGVLPVRGISVAQRFGAVGVGVVLVLLSIWTGNLASFTYPSIVMIGPAIPVIAGVVLVVRAAGQRPASAESTDVGGAHPVVPRNTGLTDAQRQALDPATEAAQLAALAEHFAETREYVAAHPNAYPDLLTWLGSLGDPRVNAALNRRAAGLPAVPPREPLPNPFSGVPTSVFVRDGIAAALLIVATLLPIQWFEAAPLRVAMVIALLLALAALAPFYLQRATIVPQRIASPLRLGLVAPLILLALVLVLMDAVSAFTGAAGGVGPAVSVGLAGAALAVVPKDDAPRWSRAVWISIASIGGVIIVLGLVATIAIITRGLFSLGSSEWITYSVVTLFVELAVIVGTVALTVLRRRRDLVLTLTIFAGVALPWSLLVEAQTLPSLAYSGLSTMLLPATAALAYFLLSTPLLSAVWPGRVSLGLVLSAAAGAQALLSVLIFALGLAETWVGVALVLLSLAVAASAFLAAASPVAAKLTSALSRSVAAGITLVLGVALVVVDLSTGGSFTFLLAVILAMPFAIIALEVPTLARDARLARERAAASAPAPHAVETSAFTAAQAIDPTTDPATLQQIAAEAPELRHLVAANPAAYEDLLVWLSSTGDARVDEALRARGYVS